MATTRRIDRTRAENARQSSPERRKRDYTRGDDARRETLDRRHARAVKVGASVTRSGRVKAV